jgi:hypothetical protein
MEILLSGFLGSVYFVTKGTMKGQSPTILLSPYQNMKFLCTDLTILFTHKRFSKIQLVVVPASTYLTSINIT